MLWASQRACRVVLLCCSIGECLLEEGKVVVLPSRMPSNVGGGVGGRGGMEEGGGAWRG